MKVYLSSTFRDLQKHRDRTYRQLRRLRHDVISMEDGVAAHQRPLEQCLADVRAADVYVGLFAWRYGYIPREGNPDQLAITELEYREAMSSGAKCLIFILDESTPWPPQFLDSQTGEGKHGKQIQRLRRELAEKHMVMFFTNPDDLASSVSAALVPLQLAEPPAPPPAQPTSRPRPGARASRRPRHPKLWNPGDELRVSFLDGSPRQRQFVERFAPIWTAYANIHFVFGEDSESEIRVSFTEPGASWAYIGTDVLEVPDSSSTVNFGWITDESLDREADQSILHEFGHVLGLQHEHQNPTAKIPWRKEAVARMFQGPPNNWPEETVEQTIYATWDPGLFPFPKPFDRESIMAYIFPADLTGKRHAMGQNVSLSQGDKEFVQRLYPY
jgi:hypothetical protein